MNWTLDKLTPEQESAVDRYGYVGAFWKVFIPRLLTTGPPKTEPEMQPTTVEGQSVNTYIPLAHRR
jgi:hypothetical protein